MGFAALTAEDVALVNFPVTRSTVLLNPRSRRVFSIFSASPGKTNLTKGFPSGSSKAAKLLNRPWDKASFNPMAISYSEGASMEAIFFSVSQDARTIKKLNATTNILFIKVIFIDVKFIHENI